MSIQIEKAPVETPAGRAVPRTDLALQDQHGQAQDSKTVRRLLIEGICVGAVLVATVVIYVFFLVQPCEPTPRNLFVIFGRGNTEIWPM